MTPKAITIQTAAPRGKFAGAVAKAFYIVDKHQVTLTDRIGNPLHDPEGMDYTRKMAEGETAHEIAAQLLRRFRTTIRGDRVAGFDRPIAYPDVKKVCPY